MTWQKDPGNGQKKIDQATYKCDEEHDRKQRQQDQIQKEYIDRYFVKKRRHQRQGHKLDGQGQQGLAKEIFLQIGAIAMPAITSMPLLPPLSAHLLI